MGRLVENFTGWKKINEALISWTKDSKSKALQKIFKREYLPTLAKVGKNWNTKTYSEYSKILMSITSEDLKGVIAFFTKKGYEQPNPQIKKLQEDLMGYMDIKSFKNKGDEDKPFNDGVFGIATAKALISLDVMRHKKYFIDKGKGDMAIKANTKKFDKDSEIIVAPKMKSDSASIQTGVKEQPIK